MSDFERVMEGLQEALAYTRGELDRSSYRLHTHHTLSLLQLRQSQSRSRAEFAADYGLDPDVLEAWEEGRVDLSPSEQAHVERILDDPERTRVNPAAAIAAE